MEYDFGVNQALVEELFLRYSDNPHSVPPEWRAYFDRKSHGSNGISRAIPLQANVSDDDEGSGVFSLPATAEFVNTEDAKALSSHKETRMVTSLQARVSAMINAYRVRGHLFADVDPLQLMEKPAFDLSLASFGLDMVDRNTVFTFGNTRLIRQRSEPSFEQVLSQIESQQYPLHEIEQRLKETYTRTIGAEFTFIEDPQQRRWLQRRMEDSCNHISLTQDQQVRILEKLTDAETFERFLHSTYVGAKRFGVDGGDSVIPLIDLVVEHAAKDGVREVVIGMAHRGRLNILVNVLGLSPQDILAAFEDNAPERYIGSGDVKYHLGHSTDRDFDGNDVHLTMSFNPSHLEFVNPVVEGRVRAKQERYEDIERRSVMPLLLHGDAAFVGQGVVAETLNLANLEGYATGGTIHIVINNQIGFTTPWHQSRSTRYCTDITRMLRCPVFHVNGEDPEAVAQVAVLAAEYRQRFSSDVVIDLYCYRKWGHNEGDEPRFTQPLMYAAIAKKRSVREYYVEKLIEHGGVTEGEAEQIAKRSRKRLEEALEEVRGTNHQYEPVAFGGVWSQYAGGLDIETPDADTRVPAETLTRLMDEITTMPPNFSMMRQIKKVLEHRRAAGRGEVPIDWGTAETLAYATLMNEGVNVRLSGQDAERGTFAHRHAVLYDAQTGQRYCALQNMGPARGQFEVYNSCLSEAGVLGFEYGYSLDSPDGLVIWEAQFGDFANGAQVLIDQFISSSEDKWYRLSGLVMLLPHGFEGQGPEHSSARLERYLSLCAEDNMMVCNLTNAAQIFHVLRRQVHRKWRKPLVIMSPKSLLRSPLAATTLNELSEGSFRRILPENDIVASKTKRILLCSGKVYFDLVAGRKTRGLDNVAIIRMEQLYPIRTQEIRDIFAPYADNTDLVWVQEEPLNSGGWFFINSTLPSLLENRFPLRCVSRAASASPATGSKKAHQIEQKMLVDTAFEDIQTNQTASIVPKQPTA